MIERFVLTIIALAVFAGVVTIMGSEPRLLGVIVFCFFMLIMIGAVFDSSRSNYKD